MTFANLKKRSPSVNTDAVKTVSVEAFIQEAENYARGLSNVLPFDAAAHESDIAHHDGGPLKQSSAYLSAEGKERLDRLSELTGISRSRLVRIWLSELHPESDAPKYLASQVR
ncbi:hypothetical protein P2G88_09725 [Aliiglaciecola sp. CAU 1673]|uniref:hypothetical protein n=1 Tax=Aliiglaciecola sp. CAU 1673 TaxID=3032595 RepID=UPI0023DB61C7|nr:hypothetical protein [Aliiglaciecola sp. CAU 1673]MDF2178532.1 hypothetical protein [Aliiglaciecola sp. CAU 1673]